MKTMTLGRPRTSWKDQVRKNVQNREGSSGCGYRRPLIERQRRMEGFVIRQAIHMMGIIQNSTMENMQVLCYFY
jgi:hypothetical protein